MAQQTIDPVQEFARQVQQAEDDPDVPKIYFNGFLSAMGAGDVAVTLKRGETPVAVLNMSYTVAKTLAEKLRELIGNLETITDHNVMTTDETTAKMDQYNADHNQ